MGGFASLSLFGVGTIVLLAMLVARRRRRTKREFSIGVIQILSGLPSNPSLPALEYLFPGRKTPPDPEPNLSIQTVLNPHPDAELPAGVRRNEPDGNA